MNQLLKDIEQDLMKAKAAVGEIREWKGIKYQKKANGQWIPLKGQIIKKNQHLRFDKFGTNYSQFENKPEEAINFLLKKKQGQVIGAWKREGLGKIDIVWGNDKRGLQHIRKRHFIEQDDFKSLEEMSEKIIDVLKNGKIGKSYDYGNKIDLYKGDFKVTLVKEIVYDDEDNFRDKIWILTSYDQSRTIEDKIRKATSDEIALEKNQVVLCPNNSSVSSRKNHLEKGQTNIVISQCSFSENKDMLKKSFEQQFGPEYFEKAKQGTPIGTIKEFGKNKFIKTENGWKYYGKKKGNSQEDEHSNKTKEVEVESKEKDSQSSLDKFAEKATDRQLKAAIEDPEQTEDVKKIAEKELEKRKGKTSVEDDISEEEKRSFIEDHLKNNVGLSSIQIDALLDYLPSLDEMYNNLKSSTPHKEELKDKTTSTQKEIKKEDSEKLNSKDGFKKITQTYIKVGDGQIIIRMKGDDRYKASKKGFSLISEPNESLSDFKKRAKEAYEKEIATSTSQEVKKVEPTTPTSVKVKKPTFKSKDDIREYMMNDSKELLNRFPEKDLRKIKEEAAKVTSDESTRKSLEKTIQKADEENSVERLLHVYGGSTKEKKIIFNKMLIENNQAPIANGILFGEYNGIKYKDFSETDISNDFYNEQLKKGHFKAENPSIHSALNTYTGGNYMYFRKYNIGEMKDTEIGYSKIKEKTETIKGYIDRNPLKENMVLTRRIEVSNNSIALRSWLTAEVGDVVEDPSFTSFSLATLRGFGNDLQITLLAKKGQKVAPTGNVAELEYITQKGSKFKVIGRGTGSIVVEMI